MSSITIPFGVAKVLYRLHLHSKLVREGLTPNEAIAKVDQLTIPELQEAIDKIQKGHPVC